MQINSSKTHDLTITKTTALLFIIFFYFRLQGYMTSYIFIMLFPVMMSTYFFLSIKNSFKVNSFTAVILSIFLILIVVNFGLVRIDKERLLEIGVFFLPLLGIYFFAIRYPIDERNVFFLFLLLLLPEAIIYSIAFNEYSIGMLDNSFTLFLIGEHHTSTLEVILFVCTLFVYKKTYKISFLFLTLLLLVLLYFSGSRGSFIAALVIFCLSILYNNRFFTSFLKLFIPILLLLSFYAMPIFMDSIQKFLPSSINSQLRVNENNAFAGRDWLWGYHFKLFLDKPYVGNESKYTDLELGGKTATGERVSASSESFFTYLLARDGIWALLWYFLFGFFIFNAIKYKNELAYYLSVMFIFMNFSLSSYSLMYTIFTVLGFWLYFSSLIKNTNSHKEQNEY